MERVGKTFKKQSFRNVIIYFLTCCLVLNTSMPIVWAEVILDSIVQGDITVTPLGIGTTQDMTATDGAIGHFSDFDIASGHLVDCVQPSSNASALFRVISGGATDILGTFNANGNIYLINPAGILFGAGSQVNVNRLVASGLDMSDSVFNAVRTNPAEKMVFTKYMGEVSGDVTNNGTINATNSAYLVGVNVTNNGSILCPNGLVVMAAGDAVQLGQPGSNVIVTLADLTADVDNVVNNSGTVGTSGEPVDKLVLAAGDVWSHAISNVKKVKIASFDNPDVSDISAYAEAASDAVSEVDIEVGGDINIDYNIEAEAVGVGANNATATIKIDADGDVTVEGETTVQAKAIGDADTADATITINAGGDIYLKDGGVEALALTNDYSSSGAGNLTALVDIDAGEDLNVGDGGYIGFVLAVAKTGEGASGTYGDITSTVDIDAGTVSVNRGNINAIAKTGTSSSVNAGDITATVEIDAVGYEGDGHVPGDIYVGDYATGALYNAEVSTIEAHAEAGSGIAGTAGNVTAMVNIDADGTLNVDNDGIQAEARVGYENSANAGNLTATVDIVTGDSVGDIENGYIEAIAGPIDGSPATIGDTSATIGIVSGGDVGVYAEDDEADIYAEAFGGVNNSADVTVEAAGDVKLYAEYYGDAYIEAEAYDGTDNAATVNVTANNGNVTVSAYDDGYAGIEAEAYYAENNNTADVTVTAKRTDPGDYNKGIVIVEENYGQASIDSRTNDAIMNNTSTTTINADCWVAVNAHNSPVYDYSYGAGIAAYANHDDESNTANVFITAGGVEVIAQNGEAWIETDAYDGVDNTAGVYITANDGYVKVEGYEDGLARIDSDAHSASNNNTAIVDVTAKGEDIGESEIGDVIVTSYDYGRAWISAYTDSGNDNSSTTTINADGDVEVTADYGSSEIQADAWNGVNNTAGVDVTTTDGHVLVSVANGDAGITSEASYGVDNVATVDVTAGSQNVESGGDQGDVMVTASAPDEEGEAWIGAYAWYTEGSNSGTGTTTINADRDVIVETYDYGRGGIESYAMNLGGSNTSNVNITAGGNVELFSHDFGDSSIYANASYGMDNTAGITIDAVGDVEVMAQNNSDAWIETYAGNDDESNTSNINITAGGNVEVLSYVGSDSSIYANAEDGITNNASVDITAGTDVRVQADGYGSYSFAGIEAEVYAGDGTNTATTTVNAGGKVVARADSGGEVDIDSESWYGSTNNATTTINAGDYVKVKAVGMGVDDQQQPLASDAAIEAEAWDSYNNTANVYITVSGETESSHSGMVRVIAEGGGLAEIEALAWNDGDVDVYTDLTAVASGLEGTIQGITNTAKVDIEAKSVEVNADGLDSSAFISSNAGNEIQLNIVDYAGNLDLTLGSISNNADISIATIPDDDGDMEGIVADNGDVLVVASNGGIAGLDVEASNEINAENDYLYTDLIVQGPVENSSDILINAGDDVMVTAPNVGDTEIDSEAGNSVGGSYAYNISLIEQGPVRNSAGVDITTGGDVEVVSSYGSYANIHSRAANESSVLPEIFPDTKDNISAVSIDAGGGVEVIAEYDSEARIGAEAEFATTNTSDVSIDAVGPVEVRANQNSQAGIMASTQLAVNRNTSNVEINAEHVTISAQMGCNAAISAEAYYAYEEESSKNTADVAIYTHAADVEPDEQSGDVLVEAVMGSEATIEADTENGYSNTSDVLICADGGVQIRGMWGSNADISAEATSAYSNTASVGIAAKGDEGVEVRAELDGRAYIESRAYNGYENTAETIVYTKGGVEVVDKSLVVTSAGIIAEAFDGYHSDAYVGVRAEDDILVMAGIGPEDLEGGIYGGTGGHAEIRAEASSVVAVEEETSANAETVVYSLNGGVAVMDATPIVGPQPGTAEIKSRANGGYTNTAYTGVYAGGDLGDLLNEEHPLYEKFQGTGVAVVGLGDFSEARIVSETFGDNMNASDTVVCTSYEVFVRADGYLSDTEIGASAEGDGSNAVTTQVYASDVDYEYIPSYSGEGGIWANAYGWPIVPFVPFVPFVDKTEFVLSEYNGQYGYHDLVWVEGGGIEDDDIATLKIRDYSKRQDCPICPPCPCCDEPIEPKPPRIEPAVLLPFVPAAPIPETIVFEISGYPALLNWVARELGVDEGSIQIGAANSLASSKEIQPYNSFSRLRKAAAILQDAGGVYINAMAQVISEYASSTVPPTEEQMAAIANVISRNVGANNQYALAGQYLDALAEYISILRDEMGFSADEAVQLATDNYIQDLVEGGNMSVASFVASRLIALGGS